MDYIALSKEVSYALRHAPWKYELEMDANGWVQIEQLIYGHSMPIHIIKEKQAPPKVLFHGTAQRFVEAIMQNGLLPMSRQYVHLSMDMATARAVGKRHGGIPFYHGNEKVWLADKIPSEYIQIVE